MLPSTHSKPEYLKFAARCDHLAASSPMEVERANYRARAALWRHLANASLAADGMHFKPRSVAEDRKTTAGDEPAGDNARKGAVRKPSQLKIKLVGRTAWTKRNKKSGQFTVVKKSKQKFKGVRREKARARSARRIRQAA